MRFLHGNSAANVMGDKTLGGVYSLQFYEQV